jgi:hypothetical protein
MFGEEGVEAVHSAMMRAAQLCQTMKNPQGSLQAIKRHLEAIRSATLIPHVKNVGVSEKKRQSFAAAAPGADGGP